MNELIQTITEVYNKALTSGELTPEDCSLSEFVFEVLVELPLDISNQLV
jgi:hypothetical protein